MDGAAIIGASSALLGVILGGGLQALQAYRAHRREADHVLQALLTEVDALVRLARHRGYLEGIAQHHVICAQMVAAGQGADPAPMLTISTQMNYFQTYDSLVSKIGMIDPWYADRITRFYLYSKSVLENYLPTSPFQQGLTAEVGAHLFGNDAVLLTSALNIGDALSIPRTMPVPKGAIDSTIGIPAPILPTAVAEAQQAERQASTNTDDDTSSELRQ